MSNHIGATAQEAKTVEDSMMASLAMVSAMGQLQRSLPVIRKLRVKIDVPKDVRDLCGLLEDMFNAVDKTWKDEGLDRRMMQLYQRLEAEGG